MDFEEQFGRALREAGQSYTLDAQPLLARSLRRGLALRARRLTYAVLGSATALALVVTGTALTSAPSTADRPAASGVAGTRISVSGARIVSLLEGMLPPGTTSGAWGIGSGGGRPYLEVPSAQLVYDDGHGAGHLELGFARMNNSDVLAWSTCPAKTPPMMISCHQTKLKNGSIVAVEKSTFGGSVLLWTATLVTRGGDRVWLDETNSATGDPSSPVTRAEPPLSSEQLSAIVENSAWSPVFAAVRAARPDGQPSQAQVIAIARRLQPPGVRFGGNDAMNQEGNAAFMVTRSGGAGADPRSSQSLSLSVQHWPADARAEVRVRDFASATALPDGTLMVIRQNIQPPQRGVTSGTWAVVVLRPDGTVVRLLLDGTPATGTAASTPAIPLDELKSMAMSPLWTR
jgi:hypothetical protein